MVLPARVGYARRVRSFKHPRIEEVGAEDVFHALGDPVRLDIVRRLGRVPEDTAFPFPCTLRIYQIPLA